MKNIVRGLKHKNGILVLMGLHGKSHNKKEQQILAILKSLGVGC